MTTQQPIWKCIGHIGDVDPIAYGGGFVYTDETGVYAPELVWFEPGTDEQWKELDEKTPLDVYRIILEPDSVNVWWYKRLAEVSPTVDLPVTEAQRLANSSDPLAKAFLYGELIHYFGAEEFDSYPTRTTEGEAYERYKAEMQLAR